MREPTPSERAQAARLVARMAELNGQPSPDSRNSDPAVALSGSVHDGLARIAHAAQELAARQQVGRDDLADALWPPHYAHGKHLGQPNASR